MSGSPRSHRAEVHFVGGPKDGLTLTETFNGDEGGFRVEPTWEVFDPEEKVTYIYHVSKAAEGDPNIVTYVYLGA